MVHVGNVTNLDKTSSVPSHNCWLQKEIWTLRQVYLPKIGMTNEQ